VVEWLVVGVPTGLAALLLVVFFVALFVGSDRIMNLAIGLATLTFGVMFIACAVWLIIVLDGIGSRILGGVSCIVAGFGFIDKAVKILDYNDD
jgi:hypothetical protein